MIVLAWRRRSPAGLTGAALRAAPLLPTLLVPYLPIRYATIPFAGFALLAVSTLVESVARLPRQARAVAAAAAAAAGALAVAAGAAGVRAELVDARRLSDAHARLLAEARAVAPALPLDRPTVVVRAEHDNPLGEIARSPAGLFKLLYPRHPDPYGLVDAAALFEWAIAREDVLLRRWDDGDERFAGARGAVLLHESGRFTWVDRAADDVAREAQPWRRRGMQLRWISRDPPR
jgi:hypothetical protein